MPSAEHPPPAGTVGVEVVRGFYDAFDGRPYEDSVATWLTADVVWQVAGDNPLAGTFRGVGEVLDAMRRYGETSGHTLELNTLSLVGDDTHVIAVHDASAHVPGFEYHAHEVDVFHIRDRQVSAMWSFSEDQAATDRLWSRRTG